MRRRIKWIGTIGAVIVLMATAALSASAVNGRYNTDIDFNCRLTSGQNIAYRIDSGCEYTTSIPNAISRLMYPSGMKNPIVLWRTQVYTDSKMDFYQYKSSDNANAFTMCFRKNSAGNYYNCTAQMDQYDWRYGEIYINDQYMNNHLNNIRELVIMHEMLHVYGCKDINSNTSIMYYATPKVSGMTADANQVLVNKYS